LSRSNLLKDSCKKQLYSDITFWSCSCYVNSAKRCADQFI